MHPPGSAPAAASITSQLRCAAAPTPSAARMWAALNSTSAASMLLHAAKNHDSAPDAHCSAAAAAMVPLRARRRGRVGRVGGVCAAGRNGRTAPGAAGQQAVHATACALPPAPARLARPRTRLHSTQLAGACRRRRAGRGTRAARSTPAARSRAAGAARCKRGACTGPPAAAAPPARLERAGGQSGWAGVVGAGQVMQGAALAPHAAAIALRRSGMARRAHGAPLPRALNQAMTVLTHHTSGPVADRFTRRTHRPARDVRDCTLGAGKRPAPPPTRPTSHPLCIAAGSAPATGRSGRHFVICRAAALCTAAVTGFGWSKRVDQPAWTLDHFFVGLAAASRQRW